MRNHVLVRKTITRRRSTRILTWQKPDDIRSTSLHTGQQSSIWRHLGRTICSSTKTRQAIHEMEPSRESNVQRQDRTRSDTGRDAKKQNTSRPDSNGNRESTHHSSISTTIRNRIRHTYHRSDRSAKESTRRTIPRRRRHRQ